MDVNNNKKVIENLQVNVTDTYTNLDKLAQVCRSSEKPDLVEVLKKRARAKYMTHSLSLGLINNNPESPLLNTYWNTYHCNTHIELTPDKAKSKYCKNRLCLVCSRIKTASFINAYYSIIKSLPDLQFVTLTRPNVKYNELIQTIDDMQNSFKRIRSNYSLRKKLKGIRKLEVTYNPIQITFHPHFHFIVSGYDNALELKNHWLDIYKNANDKAQDIRPCTSDDSLMELFKYATKIIQKDIDSPKQKTVYFEALDMILIALRHRRTFQPFGIKKPNIEEEYSEELETKSSDIEFYEWEQEYSDWVSMSGEFLSGYEPSGVIKEFVDRIGKKVKLP